MSIFYMRCMNIEYISVSECTDGPKDVFSKQGVICDVLKGYHPHLAVCTGMHLMH